jgi:hypothetical protein
LWIGYTDAIQAALKDDGDIEEREAAVQMKKKK